MWPWTHAAFGYLWHSLGVRASIGRPPTDGPVLLALFASVLPDLIDKPLVWTFSVVQTGYGPAHSVLVGLPLILLLAGVLWRWRRNVEIGLGLVLGYTSHLAGDLLFQFFDEGRLLTEILLWPLAPVESETPGGIFDRVWYYLLHYVEAILDGEWLVYAVFSLGIGLGVLGLWIADGKPGLRLFVPNRGRVREYDWP